MKILFTAPEKTSYHDNTTWFPAIVGQQNASCWLKPGERVVVITEAEYRFLTRPVHDEKSTKVE